jgi:hypothetical protein
MTTNVVLAKGDRVVTRDGYEPDVIGEVIAYGISSLGDPMAIVHWHDPLATIRPGTRAGTITTEMASALRLVTP